jgi:nitric oxide reductase subunit B
LVWILDQWASAEHPGKKYAELNAEQQAALRARFLLPVGLLQAWATVEHGMWYARSAEFMQTPLMDKLRWLRVIGDTIFAAGAVALGWFVLVLKTGWSIERQASDELTILPGAGSGCR